MKLIEFTSADNWDEKVYVNPDEVAVVKRLVKFRDMGEYSTIVMKSGETVGVSGNTLVVAAKIIGCSGSKE